MMLQLSEINISNHQYSRTNNGVRYHWDVPTLLAYVEEQQPEVFDLPLAGIDLSKLMWTMRDMKGVINHFNRVMKVDLSQPIILDEYGTICDGWHRVVKAALDGMESIKAVRLTSMPDASSSEQLND